LNLPPMKLTLPNNINLNAVEKLLGEYRGLKESDVLDITLPNEIKEQTIAGLPALIQFLGTVLREGKLSVVRSKNNVDTDSETIKESAEQYLWYVVTSLMWYDLILDANNESIKPLIHPVNREINERIRNFKILRHGFMAPCFDHLPKANGLLKMFYAPPYYELVKKGMIEQHINQIITNLGLITNKAVMGQLGIMLGPLTEIVYELFMNTHDWATNDRFGDRIEYGVRGVYFRFYRNFKKQMAENAEENVLLNQYFSHDEFVGDYEQKVTFIEISVFDCGDGFVGKYLGETYSEETSSSEEIAIIKKCLTKYVTLEDGRKGVVKGMGLDNVLTTIDNRGFLRIRTNRTCICRDMISHPYSAETDSENIPLFDWATGSADAFTLFPQTKGSVVSIILPLDARHYVKR
jgi:hypothetical protein